MKNSIFLISVLAATLFKAQFTVTVNSSQSKSGIDAYLYTLSGSKDILSSKVVNANNKWIFKVPNSYKGMLRVYIPQGNYSINLISENKDVDLSLVMSGDQVTEVTYTDEVNKTMNDIQDIQRKKEMILPALYQMNEFYTSKSPFKVAISKEIERLSQDISYDDIKHPFISFYNYNYKKFLTNTKKAPVEEKDIINFITNSNEMLETSSLLKPILISYLNNAPKATVSKSIDNLLNSVNVETPRGQTVLSELIEIFDAYEMMDFKTKYLAEASNLKCTINDRLAETIAINKSLEIGAKFTNYKFTNVFNTKAKSIYDVKAVKKIILFWSSTCSHCEAALPKLIEKYNQLQEQNIQIIGLSVDNDKESYDKRIKDLPWINDAEIRGWNSSYAKTYNIHATPTYFILDNDNKIIAKPNNIDEIMNFLNVK